MMFNVYVPTSFSLLFSVLVINWNFFDSPSIADSYNALYDFVDRLERSVCLTHGRISASSVSVRSVLRGLNNGTEEGVELDLFAY